MKTKERVHREWFRPVERGGRKSCPNCKAKLEPGESIWAWGEYIRAKWHTVQDVCKTCWPTVRVKLLAHKKDCGCVFILVPYHSALPDWMTLVGPSV